MKRSPLKRKTQLKKGNDFSQLKKRKPMRQRTPKRAKQEAEYRKLSKQFLKEHPICKVCQDNEVRNRGSFIIEQGGVERLSRPAPSTEVHHRAKRWGELLCNTRFFLPVCRPHHDFIESHRDWAEQHRYTLTVEQVRLETS